MLVVYWTKFWLKFASIGSIALKEINFWPHSNAKFQLCIGRKLCIQEMTPAFPHIEKCIYITEYFFLDQAASFQKFLDNFMHGVLLKFRFFYGERQQLDIQLVQSTLKSKEIRMYLGRKIKLFLANITILLLLVTPRLLCDHIEQIKKWCLPW